MPDFKLLQINYLYYIVPLLVRFRYTKCAFLAYKLPEYLFMDPNLFKKLEAEGLISADSLRKITALEEGRFFSMHWELKTLLYLGVLLLSGGLGILVYKNIDTIGHTAILIFIALVSAGCFYYCLRHKGAFSWSRVAAPNAFFDYILLLGCLSLLTFIGYLQFEYHSFGEDYGLATFIPMVILLISAYYFDHLGVLSLAITNMAAWVGITVTPLRLLRENDFNNTTLILTGLALGVVLILLGVAGAYREYKKHFEFTYLNFGVHLFFIAGLGGLFHFDRIYGLWFLGLGAIAYYFGQQAIRRSSLYFLLILILYMYIALSYVVVRWLLTSNNDMGAIYLALLYFITSAIGVVRLLIILNRKTKAHDSL